MSRNKCPITRSGRTLTYRWCFRLAHNAVWIFFRKIRPFELDGLIVELRRDARTSTSNTERSVSFNRCAVGNLGEKKSIVVIYLSSAPLMVIFSMSENKCTRRKMGKMNMSARNESFRIFLSPSQFSAYFFLLSCCNAH